jgi:site-specific recombinase XerD
MNISKNIAAYIADKSLSWAPSTLRNEEIRLQGLAGVLDGEPVALWNELQSRGMSKYSVVTTWTRVTDFWQFLVDSKLVEGSTNEYSEFRRKNKRQFKNAYEQKTCELTFDETLQLVQSIARPESRAKALQLLNGGLRYTESLSVVDGSVIGKGSKVREVYVDNCDGFTVSYRTFLRDLRAVGLKPHDLRKVFLTALVRDGANEFELMEAAGWSSMAPARSYINVNKDSLRARVRRIQKGAA